MKKETLYSEASLAILCVDDDPIILASLTEQLKRNFYSEYLVEEAENGETALDIIADLQAHQIEVALVIVDQIMPGMKGDELLTKIHSCYPRILTIMLTGQASATAVGNAVNTANLYRYLSKPWDNVDLILTVKEALKRYTCTQVLEEKNLDLQKLTASLEQKVTDRTVELTRINHQLKQEIQERNKIENKLKFSLHEKEILLKEIHHRVKNNLQIISSLLDFQAITIEDPKILNILSDSQNRIQSMALIHEHLYQSDNLAQVQFDQYINRLVQHLCFTFEDRIGQITPIIQVNPIQLSLETAIPCGLLVNELVTNAFKHAFPKNHLGTIKVCFYQDSQHHLNLIVSDNGVGITSEIDWNHSDSPDSTQRVTPVAGSDGEHLGLKLVRILARQLNATVQFDTDLGTTVKLAFAPLKYNPRF
ncbi:MAG: histidine kinase dimerization/phosphoacceptor domain -containing protein [Microcoleaceae cyanobacterium]